MHRSGRPGRDYFGAAGVQFRPMRLRTLMPVRAPRLRATGAVPFPPWVSNATVGAFLMGSFTATWGGIRLGAVQVADVFLLFTLLIVAMMVVFGNLRFHIPAWLWAPVAALLLCVTVLSFNPIPDSFLGPRWTPADVTLDSVVQSALWTIALVGVPIAAIACSKLESRAPKWIVAWFLAGVAFSSLIALTDLTGLTNISRSLEGYESNTLRQTGLSGHPNALGIVCVIAAPFAVHFISASRRRWMPCAAFVLLCGGVLASGSRGAQAFFMAAVFTAALFSPSKKKVLGWLATTVIATVILGGFLILEKLGPNALDELVRFRGTGASSSSDAYRTFLTKQALTDFENYPSFGVGIKHIAEAHNIYLQIISAGGIVLAAGMFAYWYGALRAAGLAMRRGEPLGSVLLVSIISWLAVGVIENQLTDRLLYYTVGCVAALAAAHADGTESMTGKYSLAGSARGKLTFAVSHKGQDED
jgi:hypothetical protein